MAMTDPDQNLLFGLLAVQINVITRDELIDAASAWMVEKSRPLGQVLLERGKIHRHDLELLDALVARHLKSHGQDPEKCLTAIDDTVSVVSDLLRLTVPETEGGDRLETLVEGQGQKAGRQRRGPEGSPPGGERFRVLRPHAKGGIGKVSVALDSDLHREVALKEIQSELADNPASRARFLLEAEVTGRLEHPGIVPVYALGQNDQGRPYYVMRFVRGETLHDAIASFHRADARGGRDHGERALSLRKLLSRFLEVCDAIAYAHSRGVIHRDLKPGNVMLGPYGETLVVDWGLAKIIGANGTSHELPPEPDFHPQGGRGSGETMAGTVVGTPAYMSPEQATGRLDTVGPPTDVYGLGATLYTLLAGKAPLSDPDVSALLERVRRGQIPPPAQVNRRVPHALDAVVRKAMALNPGDRYGSPRELAEDIEHWLANEPVTAWPEPFSARARRWLGRHQRSVTAAAAAVLVATVSLAVAAVALGAAREREFRLRVKAERHLKLAGDAVDRFFTKVSEDSRLRSAGLERLRRDLLQEARGFYEIIRKETGDDPEYVAEQGRTYLRLVRISERLGEYDTATALNETARKIFLGLVEKSPAVAEYQAGLAESRFCEGLTSLRANQIGRARRAYEDAAGLWDRLAGSGPAAREYRFRQVMALNRLGRLLCVTGVDRAEGEKVLLRSLASIEPLVQSHPEMPEYRIEKAEALLALGMARAAAGSFDAAREALEDALRTRKALAEEHPEEPEFGSKVAQAFVVVASTSCNARRPERIPELYEGVRPVIEQLVRAHPDVPVYQEELSQTVVSYAAARALLGDHAAARTLAEDACAKAPKLGMVRYGAACVLALASVPARSDPSLHREERERRAEAYLARALEMLREARGLGVFEQETYRQDLRHDVDFAPLRDREEFKTFLNEITGQTPPPR